ncbi:unnamed protein product [Rotaria sp. Silwood1]|nr:unnamed protein product [Rotaria sp. Silwood1]CAF3513217.1 unnamed protein product [Rotaria sp. Silwood1]CAF3550252.1 unnamed protein product [Rotaria sp. Silwood1]CAF4721096.1 unnamed protein product [Rotaria sp. Silwood1]CAF4911180.1 unnamed protein product [Rotaria sp. Silwood1]
MKKIISSTDRPSITISSSLYLQFNNNLTEEQQVFEKSREATGYTHFAIYGRGSTIYRINELLFQGVQNSLQNELWFLFNCAISDVRKCVYESSNCKTDQDIINEDIEYDLY